MKRAVWVVVAVVAAFALNVGPASAATALEPLNQCPGLGSGEGAAPLAKEVVGVTYDAGTATITFTLTSSRPLSELATVTRVRDCAFVDANANGLLDGAEVLVGFDLKFAAGNFVNGAEYTVTLTAPQDAVICDRGGVSGDLPTGDLPTGGFTDKSTNPAGGRFSCTDPTPPPVVPEAPLSVLLPLTALALFGGGALALRRRQVTLKA